MIPWHLHKTKPHSADATYVVVCDYSNSGKFTHVATFNDEYEARTGAAAPDLFNASADALKYIESRQDNSPECEAVKRRLLLAIHKAKHGE